MMNPILRLYRGLPISIYVIFFARVINAAGHFVLPFMTMFLTDKLGLSKELTGFYVMLSALSYVPGSFIGGKLTDHLGRKKIFMIFQGLAAVCFIPCAFLGVSKMIPWLLILSGVFGGAASPANAAMVADLTNTENRKQAYSLLYLGHNLGFAIGPMAAGLLYRNHIAWLFLGDAVTTFISIILVGLYIKETIPDHQEMLDDENKLGVNEKAESGGLISVLLKRPVFVMFMLFIMLYSFVYVQHQFTLPIQLNETFVVNGPKYFGFLMTTNAVTVVLFTAIVTKLTLKLKPITCVGLAGFFYAVGFGMIPTLKSLPMFILSTFIWTVGEILISTNAMAYVANNTPISHRGRFNAIIPIVAEAGHALGPLLTGRFLMNNSITKVWQITFMIAIVVGLMMFALQIFENRKTQNCQSINY